MGTLKGVGAVGHVTHSLMENENYNGLDDNYTIPIVTNKLEQNIDVTFEGGGSVAALTDAHQQVACEVIMHVIGCNMSVPNFANPTLSGTYPNYISILNDLVNNTDCSSRVSL